MRKKIVIFTLILMIAVLSVGGLTVFAYSNDYADVMKRTITSTFSYTYTSDTVNLTAEKGAATMYVTNSSWSSNYKYLEVTSFYSDGTNDFDEIDYSYKKGTSVSYLTTVSISGATNLVVIGQLYNTNVAAAGVNETVVLNLRTTHNVPYVDYYY